MCIHERIIVGNALLDDTDIMENIQLLRTSVEWNQKINALVNSFGFGGPHATLCLSAVQN